MDKYNKMTQAIKDELEKRYGDLSPITFPQNRIITNRIDGRGDEDDIKKSLDSTFWLIDLIGRNTEQRIEFVSLQKSVNARYPVAHEYTLTLRVGDDPRNIPKKIKDRPPLSRKDIYTRLDHYFYVFDSGDSKEDTLKSVIYTFSADLMEKDVEYLTPHAYTIFIAWGDKNKEPSLKEIAVSILGTIFEGNDSHVNVTDLSISDHNNRDGNKIGIKVNVQTVIGGKENESED